MRSQRSSSTASRSRVLSDASGNARVRRRPLGISGIIREVSQRRRSSSWDRRAAAMKGTTAASLTNCGRANRLIYSSGSARKGREPPAQDIGRPAYKSMTIRQRATTMALLERMEAPKSRTMKASDPRG